MQESKAKHITWSRPDKSRSFVILLDKCVINNRRIEIDIYRNIYSLVHVLTSNVRPKIEQGKSGGRTLIVGEMAVGWGMLLVAN